MDNAPSINPTIKTLAPGQVETIRSGGAEIFMREIKGANEVQIGLDTAEFIPIAAGEGFTSPHTKFRLKNHNAETVIVTVYQTSEPGVYIDRRDSATSVSIGGSFAVVNSPSNDEGGSVREIGQSLVSQSINLTAGADTTFTLISSAMNTNGVRIRQISMLIWTVVGANARNLEIGSPARQHYYEYWTAADSGSYRRYSDVFDMPSGGEMKFYARADDVLTIIVAYDNL